MASPGKKRITLRERDQDPVGVIVEKKRVAAVAIKFRVDAGRLTAEQNGAIDRAD